MFLRSSFKKLDLKLNIRQEFMFRRNRMLHDFNGKGICLVLSEVKKISNYMM